MQITEAEIAELERQHHKGAAGDWCDGCTDGPSFRNWPCMTARLLSERREREATIPVQTYWVQTLATHFDAIRQALGMAAGCTTVDVIHEIAEREGKIAEAEQRATNWEDDAQRYAQNSDYWKERAEAAEATLARVRGLWAQVREGIDECWAEVAQLRAAFAEVQTLASRTAEWDYRDCSAPFFIGALRQALARAALAPHKEVT